MIHMRDFNAFEARNVKFLVNKQIEYATIQITETGFKKSILDATAPVRAYFFEKGIHNYEEQPQGPENKKLVDTCILTEMNLYETQSSLYRPVTKKGDPRMWVYQINKYVQPDEIFALIAHKGKLYVINLSQIDIEATYNSPLESPIRDIINEVHGVAASVSDELLGMIRDKMSDWLPSEILADTGIGRTVEAVLGIPMNSSKLGDYKGIELKSKREKAKVRSNLFTQAPNWNLSRLKSSQAIISKYGYVPEGYTHKCLHVTLSATHPNPQGLGLNVDYNKDWLEANEYALTPNDEGIFKKLNDVSVWQLMDLHERLLTKHHETFWIDVDNRIDQGKEFFRVTTIEHTKNPLPPQFDILLEQGKITVDFLLGRNSGGDTYSFKVGKKDRALLFPESETYVINSVAI